MKTTIKSRFSLGMKIVGILSCLAIVSVGFAAWWIIKYPDPQSYESGSFTVYAVDEKEIQFTGITIQGNAEIVFGAPATPGTEGWLGYTDMDEENLTAIVKFTVSMGDANDQLSKYLDGINVTFDPGDAFELVDATYLAAPKIYYQMDGTAGEWTELTDGLVPAPNKDVADVYLKFEFGWGTATEGNNPYNYFNEKEVDATHATITDKTNKDVAIDMLTVINGLNNNKYRVEISANPKSISNS